MCEFIINQSVKCNLKERNHADCQFFKKIADHVIFNQEATWKSSTKYCKWPYTTFFFLAFSLFLLLKKASFFYLAFWLCACAFNTFTTIFCSSIRKAHLILSQTHLAHMDPPQALLTCFFILDNLIRTLGLTAQTPQSQPGHTPHADFGAFPTFLV